MQKSTRVHRRAAEDDHEVSAAQDAIRKSIETKQRLAEECLDDIIEMAHMIMIALKKGRKVVFFGNGGSAADAQHISAELAGKFKRERPPCRASALTANTSILTAIGNAIGCDEIFSRNVQAPLGTGGCCARHQYQRSLSERHQRR